MKQKTLLVILLVLSFLAVIDGGLLTYEHYSTSGSSLCNFGKNLDCGIVGKSPYATVDNIFYFLAVDMGLSVPIITISIPIAVIAIIVFILIKIGVLHIWHDRSFGRFNPKHMLWAIRTLLIFSMIYGLWLVYVQEYILRTYCLYCLGLDAIILLSLIVSFLIKSSWKGSEIKFRR